MYLKMRGAENLIYSSPRKETFVYVNKKEQVLSTETKKKDCDVVS